MHLMSTLVPIYIIAGATTPGQSIPGSDGYKEVLLILQSTSITGSEPSDCLVSYPGNSWGESYPSAEMQSMYSAAPVDWARRICEVIVIIDSTT